MWSKPDAMQHVEISVSNGIFIMLMYLLMSLAINENEDSHRMLMVMVLGILCIELLCLPSAPALPLLLTRDVRGKLRYRNWKSCKKCCCCKQNKDVIKLNGCFKNNDNDNIKAQFTLLPCLEVVYAKCAIIFVNLNCVSRFDCSIIMYYFILCWNSTTEHRLANSYKNENPHGKESIAFLQQFQDIHRVM